MIAHPFPSAAGAPPRPSCSIVALSALATFIFE
jgi:hypothetical protein